MENDYPGQKGTPFTLYLSSDWSPKGTQKLLKGIAYSNYNKLFFDIPKKPFKRKVRMTPIVIDSNNEAWFYYHDGDKLIFTFVCAVIEE